MGISQSSDTMTEKFSLEEILDLFPDKETKGNISFKYISGIASLESADRGDLTFLSNLKYKKQIHQTKASVILLPTGVEFEPRAEQLGIWIENPSLAITKLCSFLESRLLPKAKAGIHPTAFIEDTAFVDESAHIGPFCYIGVGAHVGKNTIIESHCHVGKDVIIKQNCRLFPSVKILSLCLIEDRVVINSGVVVGSDGYGFDQVDVGEHRKIPHLGKVIIENDVEIGANTTIDRARIEETRIGEGTKIDNLVQIGHNVRIGKGCLIVAQVGIAGSVRMEDFVIVGGQAGFSGHLNVGKGARIAGQSGITKDVEPGAYLKGNPALPVQLSQRISVLQRKLPELFKRFAQTPDNK